MILYIFLLILILFLTTVILEAIDRFKTKYCKNLELIIGLLVLSTLVSSIIAMILIIFVY